MLVCELAYVCVYIFSLSKFFVTSIELRERCDNVIQRLAQTRARGGFKRKRNELAALMRHSESPRTRSWAHTFVCLDTTDSTVIPKKSSEKDRLIAAGLGEKRILFSDIDCSSDCFREILYENFPRLRAAGGYQFFKCAPNSRQLEEQPLSSLSLRSPRDLSRCGCSCTYIRPLQRNLDTTRDDSLTVSVSLETEVNLFIALCTCRYVSSVSHVVRLYL